MIAGLVLAAGRSRRMGRAKLLLPLDGETPLVRVAVQNVLAAGLDEVVVVLGAEAMRVEQALAGLAVRCVVNPRFAEGQATSLAAGVQALAPGTEAVVIALGDQPRIDPRVVRGLVAAFRETRRPVVVPRYREERGHPVLFAAALFDELSAVAGDEGGRRVIRRDAARVQELPIDGPLPRDIDTWEDYLALRRPDAAPALQ